MDLGALGCAVGVEELARDVDDLIPVPGHDQTRLGRHRGDNGCLEVLFASIAHELLDVLRGNSAGHALLGLGDGKLGAVKALVLLGDGIQVDEQAVCDLARGNGYAACTKVVAALDELAGLAAAEQTLQLTLNRRVALLNLGAAGLDRRRGMGFGRAGGTADAVAAGATAQQDDGVAGRRGLAAHMPCRRCRHNGADLHALGSIAGMIELVDLARRKSDLVAVA